MAQEEKSGDDTEMAMLMKMMEQMAGAPREELGKRIPGEKCKYETWINKT